MLTADDITFLAKHTKLSKKKVKILTEEPVDLALLLDALTETKISKEEVLSLSFEVIIKYVIFRFSHHLNYDIAEKMYICNMMSKYFPYISRNEKLKSPPKEINEDFAEYCFILLGLFRHRLTQKEQNKYETYLKYFRDSDYPGVYSHLKEWFAVCEKMKTQEIFI